jgi:hypothetical protein
MTDDSLEILWRGSDPAKFTALQAALRDEGIRFWELLSHDHAGGFLNSRPYYLEAMPGFEVRVRSSDLSAAQSLLGSLENWESPEAAREASQYENPNFAAAVPVLPIDWDPLEATSEIWSGEDDATAEYLASALRENGIPSRVPDEPSHRLRVCVRPVDASRAKDIVREIVGR